MDRNMKRQTMKTDGDSDGPPHMTIDRYKCKHRYMYAHIFTVT